MDSGMEALSRFLEIVIMAVAAIAVPVAVTALYRYATAVRNKWENDYVDWVIDTAVMAAEQSGLSGYIKNKGVEKLKYAESVAEHFLADKGLVIELEPLRALIEREVYDTFNWAKTKRNGNDPADAHGTGNGTGTVGEPAEGAGGTQGGV